MTCRCSHANAHRPWKIQVSFDKNPDRKILEDCVWKLPIHQIPSNTSILIRCIKLSMLYQWLYLLNHLTLTFCLQNSDTFTLLFPFGLSSGESLFSTPIICCGSHRFNQLWFMDGSLFLYKWVHQFRGIQGNSKAQQLQLGHTINFIYKKWNIK